MSTSAKWKHPLTQYEEFQIVSTCGEIFCLIHNSIILIYHIYILYKLNSKSKEFKEVVGSKVCRLGCWAMFMLTVQGSGAILTSFRLEPNFIPCHIWINLLEFTYICTKISLYFLFVERLFTVFNGSMYEFARYKVLSSRILLILWLILLCTLLVISSNAYYSPELNICVSNVAVYVIGMIVVGDFFIGNFISILFARRLLLMSIVTMLYTTDSDQRADVNINNDCDCGSTATPSATKSDDIVVDALTKDKEVSATLARYSSLTIIAVVTTLTSLVLIAFFELASFWISIDLMINQWCVLLMCSIHGNIYKKMRCFGVQHFVISAHCLKYYSCSCCCKIMKIEKETNEKGTGHRLSASGKQILSEIEIELQSTAFKRECWNYGEIESIKLK